MRKTALVVVSLALLQPLEAVAEIEGDWVLVGLRSFEAPPSDETLEAARSALAYLAKEREGISILDEGQTLLRLGVSSASLDEIGAWIAEAELYFFQLETRRAQAALERALLGLVHHMGEEAWEKMQTSRLLLALTHLQQGEKGREDALEALLPLAGVQPRLDFASHSSPAELAELWRKAVERVATSSEGWLRVECESSCPGATVWVEGFPLGAPGEAIPLSGGSYRVVVTDSREDPRAFTLARKVRIRSGEESRVIVDLGIEGGIHCLDGPTVLVRDWKLALASAKRIAKAGTADRLVFLQSEVQGETESVTAWHFDGDGNLLREARAELGRDGDRDSALRSLFGELLLHPQKESARIEEPPPATPHPAIVHRTELDAEWIPAAKWTSAAAGAAMAGVAAWLSLDASKERREFLRLEAGGGSYGSVEDGRRARELSDSIREKESWGAALWTGAAVGAASALIFHFLEGSESVD